MQDMELSMDADQVDVEVFSECDRIKPKHPGVKVFKEMTYDEQMGVIDSYLEYGGHEKTAQNIQKYYNIITKSRTKIPKFYKR